MGLLAVLAAVTLIVFIQNLGIYEINRRSNRLSFIKEAFMDEIVKSTQEAGFICVIIILFYAFQYFADKTQ
ncbi:hypothetical protein [Tolumonas lignilytica]|uniref:hypothetical protein n=1 Tax=Tolumonas lignilytica TaxID=1283284 RepID=UPI000466E571|nr:hypothetical protein [Tolumonas lignilytica]